MEIYFFDDQRILTRQNIRRVYGRPKLAAVRRYENAGPGLPCVFEDGIIAPYVMYYCLHPYVCGVDGNPQRHSCVCMAVSNDCIKWMPYENNLQFPDKLYKEQLLPTDAVEELLTVTKVKEGGYRFFGCQFDWGNTYDIRLRMFSTADGIVLREEECKLNPNGCEALCGSFYNEQDGNYTFLIRPNWAERRCGITHTKDFKSYTEMRMALQVDSVDESEAEIYGMPVFNMGGVYIGFVCLYMTPHEDWGLSNKFSRGHMDVQLAYSFDGKHFQRALRTPFIDRGLPDSPYYGMITPYSMNEVGDKWIITAAITANEHGHQGYDDTAGAATFTLGKGRAIGLEAQSGWAYVRTRGLVLKSGKFSVNIEVPHGTAMARLMDESSGSVFPGFDFADCIPFVGDSFEWAPEWRNKDYSVIIGKPVSLEIKYCNGLIYKIEGDFTLFFTTMQIRRYLKNGILPPKLLY